VSAEPVSDGLVRLEVQGAVTHVVFASPPVNALSHQFLDEFDAALDAIPETARAVVVRSEVPRVFLAGADLDFLAHGERKQHLEYVRTVQRLFGRFEQMRRPAIAAIEGACLGGGLELALACDIRVATESARLGLPEVTLGILPGAGGPERLVRAVGQGVARDLVLTGRRINGREALAFGIVSRLAENGQAARVAAEIAGELAAGATEAIQAAKWLTVQASDKELEAALEDEQRAWLDVRASANAQEGLDAFLEKRSPSFK
jgi:enoyl-CoA hydratase/carnithine racemase